MIINSLEDIINNAKKSGADELHPKMLPLGCTISKKENFITSGFPLPSTSTNNLLGTMPQPFVGMPKNGVVKEENTEAIPADIPYRNDSFLLLDVIPDGSRYIFGVPALNSSGDIYHTIYPSIDNQKC